MRLKCQQVEQITLVLENRPGILADLCAHLSDRRVNIRAITALENTDPGTVRLVTDDAASAKEVLSSAEVAYTSEPCLAVEMPNSPGGFAGIARTLSLAGINIDYIYASTATGAGTALGILHVSDLERALALDWGS